MTMGTIKFIIKREIFSINSCIPKTKIMHTVRTNKHIAPYDIVDLAQDRLAIGSDHRFTVFVNVLGFIHPAAFGFDFVKNTLGFPFKLFRIDGSVVVVGNEGRRGGEVVQDGFSGSEFGRLFNNASISSFVHSGISLNSSRYI